MLFRSGMTRTNDGCSLPRVFSTAPQGDTLSPSVSPLHGHSKQVEFLFCHGSWEWGMLLLLLGGLENGSGMVSWFVVSEVCWSLLKVEAKLLQIFHRETPVIAMVPAAKADHGSFRCKAGVNTSSLESIIMLSVNLWNHSVSEGSSQTWAWTSDAPRRGKQQLS